MSEAGLDRPSDGAVVESCIGLVRSRGYIAFNMAEASYMYSQKHEETCV